MSTHYQEPSRQVCTFAQIQTPKDRAEQSSRSHECTLPRTLPTNHLRTNTNCKKKQKKKKKKKKKRAAQLHNQLVRTNTHSTYVQKNTNCQVPWYPVSTFTIWKNVRHHGNQSVHLHEYKLQLNMPTSQPDRMNTNCQDANRPVSTKQNTWNHGTQSLRSHENKLQGTIHVDKSARSHEYKVQENISTSQCVRTNINYQDSWQPASTFARIQTARNHANH